MENKETKENFSPLLSASVIVAAIIIGIGLYSRPASDGSAISSALLEKGSENGAEKLLPVATRGGVELPVTWGDLGARLVSVGAIDEEKFKTLYNERGQFSNEYKNLLLGDKNGKIKITESNASYFLNLFWALGLAQKSEILEKGEMSDKRYGGAGRFASTGGWTLAKGSAMDHFSQHKFFILTPEQEALVAKVSENIYRPCCDNSTHFPDCNHGMAMLGLLELLASQGASEEQMYQTALIANSYWFLEQYAKIMAFAKQNSIGGKELSPKEILGAKYSSATGYAYVEQQVSIPPIQGGGDGCSV